MKKAVYLPEKHGLLNFLAVVPHFHECCSEFLGLLFLNDVLFEQWKPRKKIIYTEHCVIFEGTVQQKIVPG